MRRRAPRRAGSTGLTLIEVTIALAVAALITAVGVVSVNSLTHASLNSTAIEIAGAVKYCYDRSIMEKRLQRIAFDMDRQLWWIEYTSDPYALGADRLIGKEGVHLAEKEEEEEEDDSPFGSEVNEEVRAALEGGKAANFLQDEAGPPKRLPGEVAFHQIWAGHQEEAFTSGVAYLHFFRGGWTEPAQIEITDGDSFLTLEVAPLTGRVRTREGQVEEVRVEEDDGREEGDL